MNLKMNNQENKEWWKKELDLGGNIIDLEGELRGDGHDRIKHLIRKILLSESDRGRKVINDEIQKKREHKLHLMESGGGIFEGTQTDFSINVLTDLLTTLYPKE